MRLSSPLAVLSSALDSSSNDSFVRRSKCGGGLDLQTEYSEEQLILAAQSGNREAFAHLYEANVEQVYQYLLRKIGNRPTPRM
jgi:hypothetical protein